MLDALRTTIAKVIAPPNKRGLDANISGPRRLATDMNPVSTIMAGRAQVMAKARQLVRNNPYARAGQSIYTDVLSGATATPQHEELTQAFQDWAEEHDLYGKVAQAVAAMVCDGEALLVFGYGDELSLQVLPSERLDDSKSVSVTASGGSIVNGVEFDAAGNRTGYWIYPNDPNVSFGWAQSRFFPASDVIHLFKTETPGQVRGLSWFAPVLLKLNELDSLTDALVATHRTSALLSVFLVNQNNIGALPFDGSSDSAGVLESGISPGDVRVLPAGYDVKTLTPQHVAEGPALIESELYAIATGLQVPAFWLSGDVSNANYSSLRAALLAFRAHVETIRRSVLLPVLYRPIWNRWATYGQLVGSLPADDPGRSDWRFEPVPSADDLKAAQADVAEIEAGFKSRKQAIAERGGSIAQVDADRAADPFLGEQKGVQS